MGTLEVWNKNASDSVAHRVYKVILEEKDH